MWLKRQHFAVLQDNVFIHLLLIELKAKMKFKRVRDLRDKNPSISGAGGWGQATAGRCS